MNGNLRLLREALALSRGEPANPSEVNECTFYRAVHELTDLRQSTIRKFVRALGVSPTEITGTNSKRDDGGRRREQ